MIAVLRAFAVAVAGLALGLWATGAALSGLLPIAVDRLGQWRFEARAGAADADPYTRARVERSGEIPLGARRRLDADDRRRQRRPRARLRLASTSSARKAPTARYWTLTPIDADGFVLANADDRAVLRSTEILREADGGFWIWISRRVHSGNWLPLGADGAFALELKLYDPALGDAAVGFERATAPMSSGCAADEPRLGQWLYYGVIVAILAALTHLVTVLLVANDGRARRLRAHRGARRAVQDRRAAAADAEGTRLSLRRPRGRRRRLPLRS